MAVTFTKDELRRLSRARANENAPGVSFSGMQFEASRIERGNLYVPLRGPDSHGHSELELAFERGASLAFVEDETFLRDHPQRDRLLFIPDTVAGLALLGAAWRNRLPCPVGAITGSIGKTSTKEITAAVLGAHTRGTFAEKSYNNHLGVPHTLCKASTDDCWVVLEMGMNHTGELDRLSAIARPDAVMITCIAPVHTEFFASQAAIADAKFEILNGLREGGTVLLNGEDNELRAGFARWQAQQPRRRFLVRWFGRCEESSGWVDDVVPHGLNGVSFRLTLNGESAPVELPFLGAHNAQNALAAALFAQTLLPELRAKQLAESMRAMTPPAMRLNIVHLANGAVMLDDSYNASPRAVAAALQILAPEAAAGKRTGVILGDMLELGKESEKFHAEAGELASKLGIGFFIGVGEQSRAAVQAAAAGGMAAVWKQTPAEAAEEALRLGFDFLLVKGSRGIKLEQAAAAIRKTLGTREPSA